MACNSWHTLSFMRDPVDPSTFNSVANWKADNFTDYTSQKLVPYTGRGPLVFAALAFASLLLFLACCCNARRQAAEPHQVLTSIITWITKLLLLLFALGGIVCSIYVMATLKPSLLEPVWDSAAQLQRQAVVVTRGMQQVRGNVSATLPLTQQLQAAVSNLLQTTSTPAAAAVVQQTLAPVATAVNNMQQSIVTQADSWVSQMQNISDSLQSNLNSVKTPANNTMWIIYRVIMAVLGVTIGFILLTLLVCGLNCPAGVAIMAAVTLIMATLIFIITVVLAMVLLVGKDVCSSTDVIIVNQLDSRWQPLGRYYVNSTGSNQDLGAVLKQVGLLDTQQINTQLQQVQGQLNVLAQAATSLPSLGAPLQALQEAVKGVDTSFAAVLKQASAQVVTPLYVVTQARLCCDVTNIAAKVGRESRVVQSWIVLTITGWMVMAMGWAAAVLLARLDRLARAGSCCACTCLRASEPLDMEQHQFMTTPPEPRGSRYVKFHEAAPSGSPLPAH
ncbi:hypothetical protein QJQ45_021278 [Haematococcus lacustris]|nr:hypothetical protein QJQ45_021278 [Haematococcus lacustris]